MGGRGRAHFLPFAFDVFACLSLLGAAVVWGPLVVTSAFCSFSCRMSVSRLTSWVRLANICSFVDFTAESSETNSLCAEEQINTPSGSETPRVPDPPTGFSG